MKSYMHFAAILIALLVVSGSSSGASSRPPNVILIMADDLSAKELGAYGNARHATPNLDRMAKDGVMFRTAWATPICSPSRAEIMTGRYAHRTKWFHNSMKPPGEEGNFLKQNLTIGEVMKKAGYATAITGKWQLPGEAADGHFDEHYLWASGSYPGFDGPVEDATMELAGRAARYWHPAIVRNGEPVPTSPDDYGPDLFVAFIRDFAARQRDQPFFMYYAMCLPHVSWDFERGRHDYLPTPVLDRDGRKIAGRKSEPTLQANVEYVDALIGRIAADLSEEGLLDNTILIFTGDNGTAGYGKGIVWQERGPRVPFIVYGPGRVNAAGARDELIDFSDVLPTLADLAGYSLPDGHDVDGGSFAWMLTGGTGVPREFIFAPCGTNKMVRAAEWLLDGQDSLWYCGDNRDETGYVDMTESNEREAVAARRRLKSFAEKFPLPPEDDPLMDSFRAYEKSVQAHHEKMKRLKQSSAEDEAPPKRE